MKGPINLSSIVIVISMIVKIVIIIALLWFVADLLNFQKDYIDSILKNL